MQICGFYNAADVADDIEDNLEKKKSGLWQELNRLWQVCGSQKSTKILLNSNQISTLITVYY